MTGSVASLRRRRGSARRLLCPIVDPVAGGEQQPLPLMDPSPPSSARRPCVLAPPVAAVLPSRIRRLEVAAIFIRPPPVADLPSPSLLRRRRGPSTAAVQIRPARIYRRARSSLGVGSGEIRRRSASRGCPPARPSRLLLAPPATAICDWPAARRGSARRGHSCAGPPSSSPPSPPARPPRASSAAAVGAVPARPRRRAPIRPPLLTPPVCRECSVLLCICDNCYAFVLGAS